MLASDLVGIVYYLVQGISLLFILGLTADAAIRIIRWAMKE